MIARISGKITERSANGLIIDVGGISYEIFLPQAVMQRIDENINNEGKINLITYHYFQVEPSKNTPVLIGFFNEVEKEFFQAFISVSGIGPRAALKAINKPISLIAKAIDEGDIAFLKSLPGIGQQRARDIVAKLQNKVGKFGLIQDGNKTETGKDEDIIEEAVSVLLQLQYKKPEAQQMVKAAFERCSNNITTTEELLNEVYKQKKAI